MLELSVDEALDDEVMVMKVVGVGVADVDDEESDEDTSLLVGVALSADEVDESVVDASLVVGEALLSADDEVADGSLLVVGPADSDEDD